MRPKLTTVECAQPGERYTLLESGPILDVHLAEQLEKGGTGPCLCGFDRRGVGFSVGGGTTGPRVQHEVCAECERLAFEPPKIEGLHARLFRSA